MLCYAVMLCLVQGIAAVVVWVAVRVAVAVVLLTSFTRH